jgi:hypothetical protein
MWMREALDMLYVENTELCSSYRLDVIPEALNPPRQPVDEMVALMVVNVGGASLLIRFVAREHVEGTDHHRVGHRHNGAFLPPPGRQAMIQGRHVRALGQRGRMRQWRQPSPQGPVPFPGFSRALCASTFVVPWRAPLQTAK